MCGDAEGNRDQHAPGAVDRSAESTAKWRCRYSSSPQHYRGGYHFLADANFARAYVRHGRVSAHLDAETLQLLHGALTRVVGIGIEHGGAGLDQQDPVPGRFDVAEVLGQGLARDLS